MYTFRNAYEMFYAAKNIDSKRKPVLLNPLQRFMKDKASKLHEKAQKMGVSFCTVELFVLSSPMYIIYASSLV